ncbi:hypothetical protein [Jiulongibacter sp. NS-SX5]|uniref:hypothetical protein n=1 Tax=Jiulongibacter sp. NS-SX5 TaxID=3463854 RepID=UPI004058A470
MNPFMLIQQFFKREREELEEPYFEIPEVKDQTFLKSDIESNNKPEVLIPQQSLDQETGPEFDAAPVTNYPKIELPEWLKDESQLRDEGVIFGLTDADARDKIILIESVFDERGAAFKKQSELYTEQIGEHNLRISRIEERIEDQKRRGGDFEKAERALHQLPRTTVSLILSVVMACGNFFLINTVMQTAYPEVHWLVTAGVFFAGMYNFFTGKSFLQHSEEEINWRRVLSETLLPFTASVFVLLQAWPQLGAGLSLGLFLFTLSLFLYSGKLFLENISLFKDDFNTWQRNLEIKRNQEKGMAEIENEIDRLTEELDQIRVEKWKIIPEMNKVESQLEEIKSQKLAYVHLFESEFKLARSYRDKLTKAQIKNIID